MLDKKQQNFKYKQLSAFAGVDAVKVGILWITSFFCFIGTFEMPLLSFLGIGLGLFSIFFGGWRLRKFRDEIRGGVLSFGEALLYSLTVFFYASVLMMLGQFLYFQFIDQGYLMRQYANLLSTPEYSQIIQQTYHMSSDQVMAMLQSSLGSVRPIEIAMQFLSVNVVLSLIVSLPIALLSFRSPKYNY